MRAKGDSKQNIVNAHQFDTRDSCDPGKLQTNTADYYIMFVVKTLWQDNKEPVLVNVKTYTGKASSIVYDANYTQNSRVQTNDSCHLHDEDPSSLFEASMSVSLER